jgi:Cu+-exporting ATPase
MSDLILYTCPMHPEVRQEGPGACPICGMGLEPQSIVGNNYEDSELKGMTTRFWVAAAFSLPLFLLTMGEHTFSFTWSHFLSRTPVGQSFQFLLATPVVLGCGWPFFQRGWISVRQGQLNMFTLISLGIGVAYIYSIFSLFSTIMQQTTDVYFEAASVITTLVLLGQVLELRARAHTRVVLQHLLGLTPQTARLIKGEKEYDVALHLVKTGDILRVRPGERVPVDGLVLEGGSAIDQSMMTGEALPVTKTTGDEVMGGTLNGTGSFVMQAKRVGQDTVLSHIIQMVSTAQRTRAPIQRLADVVSGYFVPAVIFISLLTAMSWYIWGPEPRTTYALMTSMAVLIIACPCALGLATPMSIMVGTGCGARLGILVKNAEALETLEKIDTLVVDKTGTLTMGKPQLIEFIPLGRDKRENLLGYAASLEKGSEHPLAHAILQAANEEEIPLFQCSDFQSLTGKGVIGTVKGVMVALGNMALMRDLGIPMTFIHPKIRTAQQKGQIVMHLSVDGKMVGLLIFADVIKPTTAGVIQTLKSEGIRIIMATGDNRTTALAVAKEVGIDFVEAEILPQNKYLLIEALQKKGYKVAMVGDGINDAPALAQADVGIAMGTGTDIAIESAGITLMSGDLTGILRAWHLSRATMRNIRQNLFLAFIYNALSVPIAAGVLYPAFGWLLTPMVASLAMTLSSVSVILNAVRLAYMKSKV